MRKGLIPCSIFQDTLLAREPTLRNCPSCSNTIRPKLCVRLFPQKIIVIKLHSVLLPSSYSVSFPRSLHFTSQPPFCLLITMNTRGKTSCPETQRKATKQTLKQSLFVRICSFLSYLVTLFLILNYRFVKMSP